MDSNNQNNLSSEKIIESLVKLVPRCLQSYAWKSDGSEIIKADMILSVIRANNLIFKVHSDSMYYIKSMISGSGAIDIFIENMSLAISVDVHSLSDEGELVVSFPKKHLFYDRRETGERFNPISPLYIHIEKDGKIVKKQVDNCSFGGFSVVFTKYEAIFIKKGEIYKNCRLIYNNKSIKIHSIVTDTLSLRPFTVEQSPYGGIRVSFTFRHQDNPKLKKFIEMINIKETNAEIIKMR